MTEHAFREQKNHNSLPLHSQVLTRHLAVCGIVNDCCSLPLLCVLKRLSWWARKVGRQAVGSRAGGPASHTGLRVASRPRAGRAPPVPASRSKALPSRPPSPLLPPFAPAALSQAGSATSMAMGLEGDLVGLPHLAPCCSPLHVGSSGKPNPSVLPHCSCNGTAVDTRMRPSSGVSVGKVAQAAVDAVPGCVLSNP